MEQREQNHVLHELCRVTTEEDESQMKEIKEILRFAHLCAACVNGTFCDFLLSKRAKLERCDFCVSINNFFYFLHFCGTLINL